MGFFDPKHKGKLHLVQVLLVVSVLGMGGARLLMSNGPTSRADTMALGMGAKSLIIIGYQVFSEPGRWLRRFESLKANFILNIVEVAAWGAVVYMVISSTLKQCDGFKGTSCMLAWGVIALAGNICAVSAVAVFMSYKELRMRRETGPGKGDFEGLPGDSDVHALRPVYQPAAQQQGVDQSGVYQSGHYQQGVYQQGAYQQGAYQPGDYQRGARQ